MAKQQSRKPTATAGLWSDSHGLDKPWVVCTDVGDPKYVIVLGIASDEQDANSALLWYEGDIKRKPDQRFWALPWDEVSVAKSGLLGPVETIKYGYPAALAAADMKQWLVGATVDEKLNLGFYTVPAGLYDFDRQLYRLAEADAWARFKRDVTGNPKADALWSVVYSKGRTRF